MAVTNTGIIILGASGDLAKRKLIPALARLYEKKEIDASCVILGSGRTPLSSDEFRHRFKGPQEFLSMLHYHTGMDGIKNAVDSLGDIRKYIVFFSLPPSVYGATAKKLSEEGFSDQTSIIVEKPFGYDYETARNLNRELQKYFDELQIFRIDHYLAKEAVQNILVFRFANSIFEPVWNSRYIESIQINAIEDIGAEDRAAYFDSSGIVRDMVQNHLSQLLCLLTMEPPVSLDAEDIRKHKMDVLKALSVSRWAKKQYRGYLDEKGVPADSTTETYAEIELFIENFRWKDMPVHIRTGKNLGRKGTEIGIQFKPIPKLLYNKTGSVPPNRIIFSIQPDESIIMELSSKIPGSDNRLTSTNMSFCYHSAFQVEIPEAYQRLLLDALKGDRTLFVSAQETEISWQKYAPVLVSEKPGLYDPGSLPSSALGVNWIDFENYGGACT
ncbi:MAG: glucose-6-phosphate dehydrogenase [Spirochaetales bacterium]|nr:glucose-6-phosphate dehydrogenase [Spirochaetales bacterium]